MGKKKFIDKKKSATFQLYARDSTDSNYVDEPGSDRVFVRVDNNPYSIDTFSDNDGENDAGESDSVFADAPEDDDDDGQLYAGASRSSLPEHVRREILELGFPDDGYNYLTHMREIKNNGAVYHNKYATLDQVPLDVKAYDASKAPISNVNENSDERLIYNIASRTVGARLQKVIDHEVAALLDDDDNLSRFDSDIEDLEEDFIVRANLTEEGEDVILEKVLGVAEGSGVNKVNRTDLSGSHKNVFVGSDLLKEQLGRADMTVQHEIQDNSVRNIKRIGHLQKNEDASADEEQRTCRALDEQFDLLVSQEYGSDSDDYYGGSISNEDEPLADKLNYVLKNHKMDDLLIDDKYRVPADILHGDTEKPNTESLDTAAAVIRRCVEYGKKYEMEGDDDKNVVIVEESSDESEAWDCETIVTTYSNLDNHPGKIGAPESFRKKKLAEAIFGDLSTRTQLISLGGKDKIPLDFLPHSKKAALEKVKDNVKTEPLKRKQHGQETKEEKKERKTAVKEERREARRVKKEIKELYRSEANRAQGVAATSGPSSIHLM